MKRPESENYWTTLYYGARGSCKSIHQAKETLAILTYFDRFYRKYPNLRRGIVFSNQEFKQDIMKIYKGSLYRWDDIEEFRYCPRENCWKGQEKHRLHGAYLVFDDMATILPPDEWRSTPIWLRKTFSQARKNGVRILANIQDPFACDINFRRYTDMAYKFTKLIGNADPDETRLPIKRIFGIYRRRKIKTEMLWKYGDLPEQIIRLQIQDRKEMEEKLKEMGRAMDIIYDDSWKGSLHYFTRKHCEIYNTNQNVKGKEEAEE